MRGSAKAVGSVVAAVAFAVVPVASATAATASPASPISSCSKPGMCKPAPNDGWGQAYGPAKPGNGPGGWGPGGQPYGPWAYCYQNQKACR
jgi:hypothetical protein